MRTIALENLVHVDRSLTFAAIAICTGRRHQIRVHMAHIGHPVVGDGKYMCLATVQEDSWCPGIFLHRYRLAARNLEA